MRPADGSAPVLYKKRTTKGESMTNVNEDNKATIDEQPLVGLMTFRAKKGLIGASNLLRDDYCLDKAVTHIDEILSSNDDGFTTEQRLALSISREALEYLYNNGGVKIEKAGADFTETLRLAYRGFRQNQDKALECKTTNDPFFLRWKRSESALWNGLEDEKTILWDFYIELMRTQSR
jgi:hypothetical protein